MKNKKSVSSAKIPLKQKIYQLLLIFQTELKEKRKFKDMNHIFEKIEEYDRLMKKYSKRGLYNSKIFEIGYGPRPKLMITMKSLGADIKGIDMDMPVLNPTPIEFIKIYKKNGFERAVKSLIGYLCFGISERKKLSKELGKRGHKLKIEKQRFLVGDASKLKLKDNSLDMIYSEDVFEHIPSDSAVKLISKINNWIKPAGIIFIKITIFTGIIGGHLAEWWPHNIQKNRKSEPWEHLRKKRYQANTYLNGLTKKDYRKMFSKNFKILDEIVHIPDLGRNHLTPEIKKELKKYNDEELFSNQITFILKSKKIK